MERGGDNKTTTNTNNQYRECLRNHAASLGSYATDGCGEFTVTDNSPSSLQCTACGCHRNFHRKVTGSRSCGEPMLELIDYGGGVGDDGEGRRTVEMGEAERSGKTKRFRTKFTGEQREKMLRFAEKLGWKLQRKEVEDEVEKFCRGIGVSRQVFKVWMHNHKNSSSSSSGNVSSLTTDQ